MARTARTLLLVALAALTLAATAASAAAPSGGKWKGKLTKYSNAPVTFTVSKGKVLKFTSPNTPVYCYSAYDYYGRLETRTIYVPAARVKNGRINKKHKVMSGGAQVGEVILKGRFTSAGRAKGTLKITNAGCGGTLDWSARR